MSLVQHVSAVEGLDRQPLLENDAESLLSGYPLSQAPSHSRRGSFNISYDPAPEAGLEQKEKLEPVAAYEVPFIIRIGKWNLMPYFEVDCDRTDSFIAQVTTGVFSCVIAAGIVFGFAALKPILVNEGVYRELCTKRELAEGVEICYKQDLK